MDKTSHGSSRMKTDQSVFISGNPWQVIVASAVGTVIEWYKQTFICDELK